MPPDTILMIAIILAGFYMAWNIGANDVANAMGTSVGSGALTLRQAVLVAAVLEFTGAFFFGSHVSETIQRGIIDIPSFASEPLILVYGMFSALIAAGVWLQIASYYGWPVSTTHTIVGAVVGFGVVAGGIHSIQWDNVGYIVTSWVISPFLGALFSFLIFSFLRKWIFYTAEPLKSAIKLTPFLVLLVVTLLSLILILSGFKNLHLGITFNYALLLSLILGTIGAIISRFLVRKLSVNSSCAIQQSDGKGMAIDELENAQHLLLQAGTTYSHEIQGKFSTIVDEIEHMKPLLKREWETVGVEKQYQLIERIFGYLQIMSACLMAFAHGANDVANAIGPLAAALTILQTGNVNSLAPISTWVLALGGFGIIIGLATWGWRVIETIGKKITELTPTRGFAAEFGAATTIVLASQLGMPISTTHTLVGSVLGIALARGMGALNLDVTRDIFISWMVTVPAGAIVTVVLFYILKTIFL